MVGLLIPKLRKVYSWGYQWFFFKLVNIWQSYKQERGCLVHFLRLLAVWWIGAQNSRDSHVLACNLVRLIHRFSTNFYRQTQSNKHFLIWLLSTPPHLKYVVIVTLPCNLSLFTCFMTLMFHKVVWQHMQGVVWFLIASLLQICQGIVSEKICQLAKIWQNYGHEFVCDLILGHYVYSGISGNHWANL